MRRNVKVKLAKEGNRNESVGHLPPFGPHAQKKTQNFYFKYVNIITYE